MQYASSIINFDAEHGCDFFGELAVIYEPPEPMSASVSDLLLAFETQPMAPDDSQGLFVSRARQHEALSTNSNPTLHQHIIMNHGCLGYYNNSTMPSTLSLEYLGTS